ncbi:hypothetical protein GALL_340030 [mine drainage metagenome]|uniref:Uncharacterized protein n=1 Tax=mine drainage metagenome TaxID=410659 RepID=A0A1J5R7P1_9ZZZZ
MRQGVFEAEGGGLGGARAGEGINPRHACRRAGFVAEHARAQVEVQMRLEGGEGGVEGGAEIGVGRVQATAHAGVLRALTRKQPDHGRLAAANFALRAPRV